MSDLKFPSAKYFDANEGCLKWIPPSGFEAEKYQGLLECPRSDCHGSLMYVPSHTRNGNNEHVPQHFASNHYGELHVPTCEYQSGEYRSAIGSMAENLLAGRTILFNLNFSASWRDVSLSASFARAAMQKVHGYYSPDWRRINEGKYAPYGVNSVGTLHAQAGRLREASKETGLTFKDVLDSVHINYRHSVLPWTRFQIRPEEKSQGSPEQFYEHDIFKVLYDDMDRRPGKQRYWSPSPALRAETAVLKNSSVSGRSLWTMVRDHVQLNGREFALQDVIEVGDETLSQKLRRSDSFTMVATPYIKEDQVRQTLAKGGGFVHLNWPIASPNQVRLKSPS